MSPLTVEEWDWRDLERYGHAINVQTDRERQVHENPRAAKFQTAPDSWKREARKQDQNSDSNA